MSQDIVKVLRDATDGLLYMSESDEPFEVIDWPGMPEEPTVAGLRKHSGQDLAIPVSQLPVEVLLKELMEEKPWHGPAEKADVLRYRNLFRVFKEHLPSAKVFRFGVVRVDVFILGRTTEGHWVGLKTKAVET